VNCDGSEKIVDDVTILWDKGFIVRLIEDKIDPSYQ